MKKGAGEVDGSENHFLINFLAFFFCPFFFFFCCGEFFHNSFNQKAARKARPAPRGRAAFPAEGVTTLPRTEARKSSSGSPKPFQAEAFATAALSSASSDLRDAMSLAVGTGPLSDLSSASSGPPG